jgi:Bacterial Ig-like domain
MNKSMLARIYLILIFFLLISACAKVSAPTGGRRDKKPPVVVYSVPEQGARNFKGKRLVITFDEYVVLDNMNEKFMVSPPTKKKPTISIRGKSVIVEFEEALKDSTTYTFNFMDGIKDLNEGNFLNNFQFVLSTGAVIDSLSVTGNVYNSFDLEVPESTLVLLYDNLADSAVIKNLPDYVSRVDDDGYFSINNIRPGIYKLYALTDIDNSKNYNNTEEIFAFMDSVIDVTPEKNYVAVVKDTTSNEEGVTEGKEIATNKEGLSKGGNKNLSKESTKKDTTTVVGEHQLLLFKAQLMDHYLTSADRTTKNQIIYTLSLPPDSLPFVFSIPDTDKKAYFKEESAKKDTITIWLTDSTLYSQNQITTIVEYSFTDTLGLTDYKADTIPVRFTTPRPTRGVKTEVPVYTIEANIRSGSLKPGQQIVLKSKTPFTQPDTTLISLFEQLDSSRIDIPYVLIKDSLSSRKYYLDANIVQGKKYFFLADSASFGNIFNESIDSTGIKFSIKEESSYSKLTLKIKNSKGDQIIQLLNKTEELIIEKRINTDEDLLFPLLEPGFYRVRAIYDINRDGKWTTGDFFTGRQPEPVSYYPGEIEIKKGWEVEQDWDLDAQNVKDKKLRAKKKKK